jgi:hypothetical protein
MMRTDSTVRRAVAIVAVLVTSCSSQRVEPRAAVASSPQPSPPPAQREATSPAAAVQPDVAPPAPASTEPPPEVRWSEPLRSNSFEERPEGLVDRLRVQQDFFMSKVHPTAGMRYLYATLAELDGAEGNAEGHLLEARLVCARVDPAIRAVMGYASDVSETEGSRMRCSDDGCCLSATASSFEVCFTFGWIEREPYVREARVLLTKGMRGADGRRLRVSPEAVDGWRRWMAERSTALSSERCPGR